MSPTLRKHLHLAGAAFFALQMPAVPFVFSNPFEIYLCWVSQYALVATHLAGASAELPSEGDK